MARLRQRFALRESRQGSAHNADIEREREKRLVAYMEEHEARWFWETDADGCLTYLSSHVASKLEDFGVTTIGARLSDVFRLDESEAEQARSLAFHLVSGTAFSGYPVRGRKGLSDSWWSMSGHPRVDEDGVFQGFIGSGTDLTQIRTHEAEIKRLALSDSLTGLANRQRMQDTLDQLLLRRTGGRQPIALALLDLDGFKTVNDTLGHPVGDELLKQVAQRILRAVGEDGIVGRLGGDEFEIILPFDTSHEKLGAKADKIIWELSQPYWISSDPITISCSIGIALSPEHGEDTETLVRNADLALYAAKDSGRATYKYYEDEMLVSAKWRKEMEDDLRLALGAGQLRLVYQPVVATKTEELVGFEALLRWDHPEKGAISPAEFIPVAEETGLIEPIGEWVLRTATRDLATLPEDLRVAVNVSAVQFANPSLPATVLNAIADAQIDPARLELEITESVFLGDQAATAKMFKSLKDIRVRLALDDFGTGYSSLAYLKSAPFDKIKIDQSFVRGASVAGNRNAAIIEAIVALSKSLGMETTAEGVEHQDEIELIRKLGCSHIQGFVYGGGWRLAELLPRLETGSRKVLPVGHKRSRAPRRKLLRSARMRVNEHTLDVRIRNISSTGAMIDSVNFPKDAVGVDILIELLESEMSPATIRWTGNGQAGIEFGESLDESSLEAIVPAAGDHG